MVALIKTWKRGGKKEERERERVVVVPSSMGLATCNNRENGDSTERKMDETRLSTV